MDAYTIIFLAFAGWVLWEGGRRYGHSQAYERERRRRLTTGER